MGSKDSKKIEFEEGKPQNVIMWDINPGVNGADRVRALGKAVKCR